MSDSWMRMMEQFGQSITSRAPQQTEAQPDRSVRPATPMGDSSSLMGWISNFGTALADRGRQDPSVPHEGAQYNPGTERYLASTEMFPGSGTGRDLRVDPYSPEEQADARQRTEDFVQAMLFGPERESWVPGFDDASKLQRLARDWGLSEQEFRLAAERLSEGRLGAGAGWGALGLAAAIPVVGWTGRALVKSGRAAARVSGAAGAATARSPLLREGAQTVPGDWVRAGSSAEVPTEWVAQFREYDRAAQAFGDTDLAALARSISEEGFKDHLILEVGLNGRASLIEGNHRLAVAQQLGLENVPVRVVVAREVAETAGSGVTTRQVQVNPDMSSGWIVTPQEALTGVPPAIADTPNLNRIGRELADSVDAAASGRAAESAANLERTRITPDMSVEEMVRLPSKIVTSTPVLDIPTAGLPYFRRLLSSQQDFRFWSTTTDYRRQAEYIPDLSSEFSDAIVKFVDSRPVSPFRDSIARDLSQPVTTRVLTRFGFQTEIKNPVRNRQAELSGQTGAAFEVSNMGDAVAHWQYIGNQNIQSLLRTGQLDLPFHDVAWSTQMANAIAPASVPSFYTRIDQPRITDFFTKNAEESIRYLDEFIAGSTKHGGFTGFRGLNTSDALYVLGIDDIGMLSSYNWLGVRISDPGYTAVSISPSRAAGFATSDGSNKRVQGIVFQIHVPSSMPAGSVSGSLDSFAPAWNREYEMLLPRGTQFEIVDVITDRRSLTYDTVDAIIRIRPVP